MGEAMPETRRLTTIMALDAVGYSHAAERDDAGAAALVGNLREAITSIATPLGGRIFNTAGDGFMLEFPSAASGVQAALALLIPKSADEPPLPRIRVGLHLGDVITMPNGDLLGHGVNVAARLQALAQPGTAIVSDTVRTQLRSGPELPFIPLGRVRLDKMSERLAVFALNPGDEKGMSKIGRRRLTRMAALALLVVMVGAGILGALTWWGASAQMRSIAVLPFSSESPDVERAYLGRVVPGEIIEILSQLKGMEVIARNSSFTFEPDVDIREVGTKLGVGHVLSGTVREEGHNIHVSASLADARTGRVIWTHSDTTPFTPQNVPAVQKDIAERVAGAMSIAFNVPASSRLTGGSTKNLEAYNSYLRGLDYWYNGGPTRDAFARATTLDPDYAEAWAGQAIATASESLRLADPEAARRMQRDAYAMAERAVKLAPELSVTQACYGALSTTQGKWGQAEIATAKAMEISRGELPFNHRQNTLSRVGRSAESYELMLEQQVSDPLSDLGAFRLLGVLPATGRQDELLQIATSEDWFGSKGAGVQMYGLMARVHAHQPAAAIRDSLQRLAQQPDRALAQFAGGLSQVIDDNQKARAFLRTAYDDPAFQHSAKWEILPFLAAWVGDDELVLRVWRDGLPVNTMRTIFIWGNAFDGARARPEFKLLARELGLVDYWRTYRWADKCRPLAGDDFECG